MADSSHGITRRAFVAGTIVLPALAGLFLAETTPAQAKATQTQFKYQKTPKDGHQCSQCRLYVAGKPATANGTCQVVEGSISPKGWCTAFSAKSS